MSSTNRSKAREDHLSDYYVTPVQSILDFLMEFDSDFPELSFTGGDKKILDPCAGGDTEHQMSYPEALFKYKNIFISGIETVDSRIDSRATYKENYLNYAPKIQPDVIITNPPFNIALDVITKALNDVKDGGLVVMLLRLNFFGSKARSEFFRNTMPMVSYCHSRRMKFTNTTGTDSIEYMHAVWQRGNYPKFTKMRVI
jgi:hypothetical protein